MYREMLLLYVEQGRTQVNSLCADLEPWQVIGLTALTTLGGVWAKGFLFQQESKEAPTKQSTEIQYRVETGQKR